jgi:formylmethanofuran dehydrogenase subunit E
MNPENIPQRQLIQKSPCAVCGQLEPAEAASSTPGYWVCTSCRDAHKHGEE